MDRTTKILLALIAGGLWANALSNMPIQAKAQEGDLCLSTGDCLSAINGWAARSSHFLGSIATDMKLLVTAAQAAKSEPTPAARAAKSEPAPAAPVKPRATPAPVPAKPSPCLTGVC